MMTQRQQAVAQQQLLPPPQPHLRLQLIQQRLIVRDTELKKYCIKTLTMFHFATFYIFYFYIPISVI